ncbi:hypothetical protein KIPB_004554 [Kipferlia bialata]|uniref:Uncharacterized protein n=1 Tax=Kipferlia bialata TaxID=797122 RepID=A0A391NKU1_9EUKA|nr:hypothetical protein KIPB_004554 [Kipferlia bialata]|eukprot:g4554.t1
MLDTRPLPLITLALLCKYVVSLGDTELVHALHMTLLRESSPQPTLIASLLTRLSTAPMPPVGDRLYMSYPLQNPLQAFIQLILADSDNRTLLGGVVTGTIDHLIRDLHTDNGAVQSLDYLYKELPQFREYIKFRLQAQIGSALEGAARYLETGVPPDSFTILHLYLACTDCSETGIRLLLMNAVEKCHCLSPALHYVCTKTASYLSDNRSAVFPSLLPLTRDGRHPLAVVDCYCGTFAVSEAGKEYIYPCDPPLSEMAACVCSIACSLPTVSPGTMLVLQALLHSGRTRCSPIGTLDLSRTRLQKYNVRYVLELLQSLGPANGVLFAPDTPACIRPIVTTAVLAYPRPPLSIPSHFRRRTEQVSAVGTTCPVLMESSLVSTRQFLPSGFIRCSIRVSSAVSLHYIGSEWWLCTVVTEPVSTLRTPVVSWESIPGEPRVFVWLDTHSKMSQLSRHIDGRSDGRYVWFLYVPFTYQYDTSLATIETLDLATHTWTSVSVPVDVIARDVRCNSAQFFYVSGYLVVCAQTCWAYDTDTKDWMQWANAPWSTLPVRMCSFTVGDTIYIGYNEYGYHLVSLSGGTWEEQPIPHESGQCKGEEGDILYILDTPKGLGVPVFTDHEVVFLPARVQCSMDQYPPASLETGLASYDPVSCQYTPPGIQTPSTPGQAHDQHIALLGCAGSTVVFLLHDFTGREPYLYIGELSGGISIT